MVSRLSKGMSTLLDYVVLWAASRGTEFRWAIAMIVIFLVAIAVFTVPSVQDRLEELAGPASHEAPDTAVGSGEAGSRNPESLSGTWRVFQDDSESAPLFDLTFAPGGEGVLLLQSDVPGTIENWSYTEDGDEVEVEMTYRYAAKDGGVFTPRGWLHLRRSGDEMRGSFEVDDYIYEGREKGMTVRGQATASGAVYARPK